MQIIRGLLRGRYVNFRGRHFQVESARVWDLPATPPPIGIAVSGRRSCSIAGELGDVMIAVEPSQELGEMFDAAGGAGKPRVGQAPVSFDTDRDAAVARAHAQFRWFGGGWKVNSELPGTAAFAGASQYVKPEDVAAQVPCGPDVAEYVEKIRPFADAGFTHVALVQIGGQHQAPFLEWAQRVLLPRLREL